MSRFRPVRAGIIGVWDYEDQIFEFAAGRLVLRGPNGSGKTKALELLMPFVLDGSIDPRRLDPFSGKDRTMQSNLLYGGNSQRRGYCWMEFRKDEQVVTVGVGLRTDQKRPRPQTWFFVTDRVVGETQCFDKLETHRKAVNQALFGYEGERFGAMIELILTLRRPQLAKDLEPDSLSDVLSEGLRTVNPDELRSSAAAFDNLESSQRDLSELERANKAAADLVATWRSYLRTRAKARLGEVTAKALRVDETNDGMRALTAEVERWQVAADVQSELVDHAKRRGAVQRSQIDALKQRDAYKNRGQLEDAKNVLSLKRQASEETETALATCSDRLKRDEAALAQAQKRHRRAQQQVHDTRQALTAHCRACDVPFSEPPDVEALRVDLVAAQSSVTEVLAAHSERDATEVGLKNGEDALQRRVAELEQAETEASAATKQLRDAIDGREREIKTWHAALSKRPQGSLDLSALTEAVAAVDGDATVQDLVATAWQPLRELLTEMRHAQREVADRHSKRLNQIDAEIETIGAQRDDAPPAPPTRRASREGRVGAPLWRLVRFADDLSVEHRAGLEGALLASGLLDSWVDVDPIAGSAEASSDGPTQTLCAGTPARDDTAVRIRPAVASSSLADVLVAEDHEALSPERIGALLAGISLSDIGAHVATDGSFALGPLVGAHHPERARYIGATARAEHRAQRIAGLRRVATWWSLVMPHMRKCGVWTTAARCRSNAS